MKYISTRGQAPALNFEEVLLTGLAPDGGLYVPETLPHFGAEEIKGWSELGYRELAFRIITPFVDDSIDSKDLWRIIDASYNEFRHPAIAPLVQTGHNEWVLELFHGPTLAFKDFALQLLGRLLDYFLKRRDQRAVVMGATSGDTGSAAIHGCAPCQNLDIFILHPHERVSPVQRRQMTTVTAANVHNIALRGHFDHCQAMVKASFADQSFLPDGRQLVAVNSINWARIMAQIVYYFYVALAVGAPERAVSFSVPTGNFGDIFAGYLAQKMGLPIQQLIIATNSNDILHRVISRNQCDRNELMHTMSPSMDIVVSSNFERLLFDCCGRDGAELARIMSGFGESVLSLPDSVFNQARALFDSHSVDDDATVATIAEVWKSSDYLLDPHSAIGLNAARARRESQSTPMISLATAHPAKFSEAVRAAGYPHEPDLPAHMQNLMSLEERFAVIDNDLAAVQQFISSHISA